MFGLVENAFAKAVGMFALPPMATTTFLVRNVVNLPVLTFLEVKLKESVFLETGDWFGEISTTS
jgi:hypothetical protein